MSEVSIVKCPDYEKENVYQAVKKCIDLLGGMQKFIRPGYKVLLKPNLLSPRPPERVKTTHPEVIRALIKIVKEAGGIPYVGDSPGGNIEKTDTGETLASIQKYWVSTGMKQICEEEKTELVVFETGGVRIFKIPERKYTPEVIISKVVFDFDFIINVPKLKTHSMVLYTGAIKNMYGCVPGLRKTVYHKQAIRPDDFSELLVDIYSIIKPGLSVMDAIWGMDGQGPSAGRKVFIGAVFAGVDPVAVDSVGARIFGFKPQDIATNRIGYNRGLGEINLEKIKILGDKLEDIILKKPLRPSNAMINKIPQWLMNILGGLIWARPVINNKKCKVCMVCVKNCPVQTITLKENYPFIEKKKCITCFCCHELCNYNAIDIKMSLIVRILRR